MLSHSEERKERKTECFFYCNHPRGQTQPRQTDEQQKHWLNDSKGWVFRHWTETVQVL